MKNIIGYDGGHTVYELGPATDGMFFSMPLMLLFLIDTLIGGGRS